MSGAGAYSSSDQYGASGSSGSSASSYDYGDNSNYNSGGYGAEAPGSYSGDSGYGSDGYGAGGYSSGGYGSDGYSQAVLTADIVAPRYSNFYVQKEDQNGTALAGAVFSIYKDWR